MVRVVVSNRCGRVWLNSTTALCGVLSAALLAAAVASPARAMPQGGTVVSGSATITQSGSTLKVVQTTDKAAINWQSYNISASESVTYYQPSTQAITLNRILGGSTSFIDGKLSANGQVWLSNPAGIHFGPNARVNVGGLIATTHDLKVEDFNADRYRFKSDTQPSGIVENQGRITVADAGLAAFVAPGVVNHGVITARLGEVTLASGNEFTVDLYGDQKINLALDNKVAKQVLGRDGKPLTALVKNDGQIFADGGRIQITAAAAKGIVDNVVSIGGIVQARSVEESNGDIVLSGEGGAVQVSGTLDASGRAAGRRGGTVAVSGNSVRVKSGARIDVSGATGGGQALIGGDFRGGKASQAEYDEYALRPARKPVPPAETITVEAGALLTADALSSGTGGELIVWSDGATTVKGSLTARGGAGGGDGGFIETSGHWLDQTGATVSAAAARGTGGTWLLDPYNLTITGSATSATAAAGSPYSFTSGAGGSNVLASDIEAQLNQGVSVVVQTSGSSGDGHGNGDITVNANITKSAGGDASLMLSAFRDIVINGVVISSTTGKLNTILQANNAGYGGAIAFYSNSQIVSNGGNIILGGGGGSTGGDHLSAHNCYTIATCSDSQGTYSLLNSGYALGDDTTISSGNGITLVNTRLQSSGGNIAMRGMGGTSTTNNSIANNHTAVGVTTDGGEIDSGTGTISIVGKTQAVTSGADIAQGLELSQDVGTIITSANTTSSAIYLYGDSSAANSSSDAQGVQFNQGASVSTTAAGGGITIIGKSNSNNYGIKSVNTGADISVASGGTLTLQTDRLLATWAGRISGTGGSLVIEPLTAATTIGIGTGTGTLSVPASYFSGAIQSGFSSITVGSANSGTITATGTVTPTSPLTLKSGSNIVFTATGAITDTVAHPVDLSLQAAGSLQFADQAGSTIFKNVDIHGNLSGGGLGCTPGVTCAATGDSLWATGIYIGAYAGLYAGGDVTLAGTGYSGGSSGSGAHTLWPNFSYGIIEATFGAVSGRNVSLYGTATKGDGIQINFGATTTLNSTYLTATQALTVVGDAHAASGAHNGIDVNGSTWRGATISATGRGAGSGKGLTFTNGWGVPDLSATTSVSLIADSMSFQSGTSVAGGGALTVKPYSSGSTIGLGSGTGTLSLAAWLFSGVNQVFQDGFTGITIGDSSSGAVTAGGAVVFTDPATIRTGGGITINSSSSIATNAGGDDLVLAAEGAFVNHGGASALSAPGARWLVYSNSPGTDTFGGLNSGTKAIWGQSYTSLAPGSVAAGKHYIFANAADDTITVTTTNASKTAGDAISVASNFTYSGSPLTSGTTYGVYLNYTLAELLSTLPTAASAGAGSGAAAGSYAITASGAVAQSGFSVAYANTGILTVAAAAVTPSSPEPSPPTTPSSPPTSTTPTTTTTPTTPTTVVDTTTLPPSILIPYIPTPSPTVSVPQTPSTPTTPSTSVAAVPDSPQPSPTPSAPVPTETPVALPAASTPSTSGGEPSSPSQAAAPVRTETPATPAATESPPAPSTPSTTNTVANTLAASGTPPADTPALANTVMNSVAAEVASGTSPATAAATLQQTIAAAAEQTAASTLPSTPQTTVAVSLAQGGGQLSQAVDQALGGAAVTPENREVALAAIQQAQAGGADLATALGHASEAVAAAAEQRAASAVSLSADQSSVATLASGGTGVQDAVAGASKGMDANQSAAFTEAFNSQLAQGVSPAQALENARASAEVAGQAARDSAVALSADQKSVATLANGGAAVGDAVAAMTAGMSATQSAAFAEALNAQLAQGVSPAQALEAARASAESAQQVARDTSVTVSRADSMVAAMNGGLSADGLLSAMGLKVPADSPVGKAAINAFTTALANGVAPGDALASAQAAAGAAENQVRTAAVATREGDIQSMAGTHDGAGALHALIGGMDPEAPETKAFVAAIDRALAQGLSGTEAREAATAALQAARAQLAASQLPANPQSRLIQALAKGEGVSEAAQATAPELAHGHSYTPELYRALLQPLAEGGVLSTGLTAVAGQVPAAEQHIERSRQGVPAPDPQLVAWATGTAPAGASPATMVATARP